jgi:peptidoglycan glycosyltransferase
VSRRLSILASAILVLFVLAAGMSAWIQFFHAPALDASSLNPRVTNASSLYSRGDIAAADGTILARSVPTHGGLYPYQRIYPLGSLTSGVVGFSGPAYGTWGLEAQYDSVLTSHAQPPQSLEQLLAPTSAPDSVTLTLEPALQRIARAAMKGQDGGAVVLDPRTGAVLAMYSNPNYNPAPLASSNFTVAKKAWAADLKGDGHGFAPLVPVATQQTFPPGSTFKVVTTAAAVLGKPALLTKYYPSNACISLPNSNKQLCNDGGLPCGGTVAVMLPQSCDPGYALLGMDIGGPLMSSTANAFGYNETPPLDLPGVVKSYFPPASVFTNDIPQLAYSSIGQQNVRTTALQDALVAAAIAHGGAEMTPHLMSYVTSPDGQVISRYKDSVWKQPLKSSQAAQIVPLMVNVVKEGTAYGIFRPQDDVAAKTGTAQTGNSLKNTDDWMIAFAPANDPTVAVAVVMPFQAISAYGATVAGPIVKCLVEGALAIQRGLRPPSVVGGTCPS